MTTPLRLRACRASPSSGEVCLEVYSRYVSLCLHLFFSIMNLILHVWLSSNNISNFRLPIADLLESGGKALQRNKSKDQKPKT